MRLTCNMIYLFIIDTLNFLNLFKLYVGDPKKLVCYPQVEKHWFTLCIDWLSLSIFFFIYFCSLISMFVEIYLCMCHTLGRPQHLICSSLIKLYSKFVEIESCILMDSNSSTARVDLNVKLRYFKSFVFI